MARDNKRQIHVYIPLETLDECDKLLNNGVYASMSDLIRAGVASILDDNADYLKLVKDEPPVLSQSEIVNTSIMLGRLSNGQKASIPTHHWERLSDEQREQFLIEHQIMSELEWKRQQGIFIEES